VNTVAPGITDTGKIGWLLDDTELLTSTKAAAALDRVGQPEDIADVVAFLASDDASRFTGHLLDATGGGSSAPACVGLADYREPRQPRRTLCVVMPRPGGCGSAVGSRPRRAG
jgi:hypothetical protein